MRLATSHGYTLLQNGGPDCDQAYVFLYAWSQSGPPSLFYMKLPYICAVDADFIFIVVKCAHHMPCQLDPI